MYRASIHFRIAQSYFQLYDLYASILYAEFGNGDLNFHLPSGSKPSVATKCILVKF